jgi:hypothetical protein
MVTSVENPNSQRYAVANRMKASIVRFTRLLSRNSRILQGFSSYTPIAVSFCPKISEFIFGYVSIFDIVYIRKKRIADPWFNFNAMKTEITLISEMFPSVR